MKTNKPLFLPDLKDFEKKSFKLSKESISLLEQYCSFLSSQFDGRKFQSDSVLDKLIANSLLQDKGFKEWTNKSQKKR